MCVKHLTRYLAHCSCSIIVSHYYDWKLHPNKLNYLVHAKVLINIFSGFFSMHIEAKSRSPCGCDLKLMLEIPWDLAG